MSATPTPLSLDRERLELWLASWIKGPGITTPELSAAVRPLVDCIERMVSRGAPSTAAAAPDPAPTAAADDGAADAWRRKHRSEAAVEVSAIGELLQREFAHDASDMDHTLVRSLGGRLEVLAGVLLSTDDSLVTEDYTAERIFGPLATRARREEGTSHG